MCPAHPDLSPHLLLRFLAACRIVRNRSKAWRLISKLATLSQVCFCLRRQMLTAWICCQALQAIYAPLHLNLLGVRRVEETVCSALSSVVGPSVVPRAGFGASTAAIRALTTAEELSAKTAGAAVGFCSSLGPLMRGKENGRGTLRSC